MNEWEECELGDMLTLKRGYDLPHKKRQPGAYPIISSSGPTGTHVEAKVAGPGVVTGRYGTLGEVFFEEGPFWPLNTALYVSDFKKNDPRFLAYYLKTLAFAGRNAAGAVPGVNRNHLHRLPAQRPPLEVQQHIAGILSAYDDLIAVNERRIAVLEEMVRRVFERWFLAPSPEEIAAEELIDFDPRLRVEKGRPVRFVPMGSLSTTGMVVSDWEKRPKPTGAKFQNGDTLFARITPCLENGKTGYVGFLDEGEVACGSTEFIVMRGRTVPPTFAYCLARSTAFRNAAQKSMSGASGRQRARSEALKEFQLPRPDQDKLDAFDRFAAPAFEQVLVLARQNANLRITRDLLLPRLISGEIDLERAPFPADLQVPARETQASARSMASEAA